MNHHHEGKEAFVWWSCLLQGTYGIITLNKKPWIRSFIRLCFLQAPIVNVSMLLLLLLSLFLQERALILLVHCVAMKNLTDLLRALEIEEEALESCAPQSLLRSGDDDAPVERSCGNILGRSSALVVDSASLHQQLVDASTLYSQLKSSNSHPLPEMEAVRASLLDLRIRLTDMWTNCGVDCSSIVALTEAAQCDDQSDLFDEVPAVWAQTTDIKDTLHQRTIQLRLLQRLASVRKHISVHLAATRALSSLQRREKRLRNDLDEGRVVLEFIQHVCDRIAHVTRMVQRSGIDESALLDLHKATILEEERAKYHVAGNDIKGLKAITNGYKMKSVKSAAILPEMGALESLLRKKTSIERTVFSDIGLCRAAWKELEEDCMMILDLVSSTRGTHQSRRMVADVAYETVMQSLATKAIDAIR